MFTFSVAYKFFKSKKSQTILILLGFSIGIAVNIFVGSLIQSLEVDLINTTIGTQPHVTIKPVENETYVDDWQDIVKRLQNRDDLESYTTSLDGRAFITNINPDSPNDILLRGTDLSMANQIYQFFDEKTFYGEAPQNDTQIIIGKDLAEELKVNVSDILEIKVDPRPGTANQTVEISGIFDLGVADLNLAWVFSPINIAENVFNTTSEVTGIYMQVNNVFEADIIAEELRQQINSDLISISNWKESNADLLSGLEAQASSSTIIQVFVLMSVVIGIASVLSITVIQKSRQIGILKAMGLNNRRSAYVFLFQGLLYGLFGSIIGTGLGIGMAYAFNFFSGGADGGLFDIIIDPQFVLITNGVAILFSLIASSIPARTSANMEVIDIIRNN